MVADLAVNISANIKDLQKNIGRAKATLKNFGSTATSIGTGLTASLTLPIASLGGVALKTASDFEQLEVRLQTLTGSAKAGRKQFELLQKFSAGTPFQLQDLVKANNTLLGFGLSADEAFTSLQQLGDVASATGADLQSIAVAFGQSSAEGKLFTRDIRQFINQGVPAVDLLAESMGVARSEVFTLAEEGKISFKVLQDAISQATSAGGKFAGATKAQSQTIAGLFSTLRDNVSLALGELGKELVRAFNLDKLVTDLTNKIKAVTIVFKALSSDVKKRMFIVAGVLGASGPVTISHWIID
jgi:tape measure domain-containing protein